MYPSHLILNGEYRPYTCTISIKAAKLNSPPLSGEHLPTVSQCRSAMFSSSVKKPEKTEKPAPPVLVLPTWVSEKKK